jgi:O-antigen ligase
VASVLGELRPSASDSAFDFTVSTTAGRVGLGVGRISQWRADSALPALVALASIGIVAADQGGYFPTTWGWTAVAFLWISGLAVLLRETVPISRAQTLFLFAWTALLAWTALSMTWSTDRSQTVLEIERTLVYVAAAAMFVLLCSRRSQRPLVGGVLWAIGAVCLFSLATKLFPNVLRVYDPTAVNRLAEPLGYWNGLSAFAAIGIVLALGFAAHGRTRASRAAAAALLVPLLSAFYFTFGRSGWIALAAGAIVSIGLNRYPLKPLALLVALGPLLALDVGLSSRRPGLTHAHASLAQTTHDGRALALRLMILALAAAAVAYMFWLVEQRTAVSRSVKVAFAIFLAVACVAGGAFAFARYGSPASLAQRAWHNFKTPPSRAANLNKRLLSLSGNGRYQLWRLAVDDARNHPWLGSGAGSYERYFLRHQPAQLSRVRDAHNLYAETLAELGLIGLALLIFVLGLPLVAVAKRRLSSLTAVAAGAYVVFLVHAASDWDWELPAVPLAALVCAAAMLLDEQGAYWPLRLSVRTRIAAVAVAAGAGIFALVGLLGNSALAASRSDLAAGKITAAERQAERAASWAPWSPDPWDSLGNAQLVGGRRTAAVASFHKGLSIDRKDWRLWYDLARATTGATHRHAVAKSLSLYPRSGLRTQTHGTQAVHP